MTSSLESLLNIGNRNHKDTVFRDLFGAEDRKENALSLYNALAGTNHTDTSLLEVTTLEDVLYMGYKNDTSILIDDRMMLWEHQSTHNPNMPLRGLFYFARLYQAYVGREELDLYSTRQLKIPRPHYFVFYNGVEKRPEREILCLSSSYAGEPLAEDEDPSLEVRVVVININKGFNERLMDLCKTLADYATFISHVRKYHKEWDLTIAIDMAVRRCIEEGVLADYLKERWAEVREMFITEYDAAEHARIIERDMRREREEARREGIEQGIEQGEQRAILRYVRRGIVSVTQAAEDLGVSVDELERILAEE